MKKFLAVLLSAVCVATSSAVFAEADGTDPEVVQKVIKLGLMSKNDGDFRGREFLTRAELAAVIVRAKGYEKEADISAFSDAKSDAWYYKDMAKAYEAGILTGSGNALMPEKRLTREEAMTVLCRAYNVEKKSENLDAFLDAEDTSEWAKESLCAMVENGKVSGYPDKTIRPKNEVTRLEFAYLLSGFYADYSEVKLESPLYSAVFLKNSTVNDAVAQLETYYNIASRLTGENKLNEALSKALSQSQIDGEPILSDKGIEKLSAVLNLSENDKKTLKNGGFEAVKLILSSEFNKELKPSNRYEELILKRGSFGKLTFEDIASLCGISKPGESAEILKSAIKITLQ